MRKLILLAVAAVVPLLAIAGFAAAGGGESSLDALREATAKYHDVSVAMAEHPGAFELPQTAAFGGGTCIANGTAGAMGIHLMLPGTGSTEISSRPSPRPCSTSGATTGA